MRCSLVSIVSSTTTNPPTESRTGSSPASTRTRAPLLGHAESPHKTNGTLQFVGYETRSHCILYETNGEPSKFFECFTVFHSPPATAKLPSTHSVCHTRHTRLASPLFPAKVTRSHWYQSWQQVHSFDGVEPTKSPPRNPIPTPTNTARASFVPNTRNTCKQTPRASTPNSNIYPEDYHGNTYSQYPL
jgi:hypothetical protein